MSIRLQKNLPIIIGTAIALVIVMAFAFVIVIDPGNFSFARDNSNIPAVDRTVNLARPTLHTKDTTVAERKGFINKIGYPAIKAYQKHQNYQVLPSVVIAQAIVESDWGRSQLYTEGHNVFGVKGTYAGKSITLPTTEYEGGVKVHVDAAFRKYPSVEDSILDHDALLKNQFIRRNQDMNYKQACRLIKAHGYATDPNYANTLIHTIQLFHLYRYDRIGLS